MNYQLKMIVINAAICLGTCLFFGSCFNVQKKLTFVHLNRLDYVDTSYHEGRKTISKIKKYVVQGYKNNKAAEKLIDSFVHKNNAQDLINYSQYHVVFYKESDQTNIKNIEASPRIIDRYSQDHDWIYSYKWSDGELLYKWKIKKGKIIKPKQNIKLEDIPNEAP